MHHMSQSKETVNRQSFSVRKLFYSNLGFNRETLIIHVPILQRKLDWDDVPTFDSQRSLAMTKLVDDIVDFSFNLDYM